MYSKLTIKIPERRQWRRSDVFFVNFEYILHLVLVFLLLTLNRKMPVELRSAQSILSNIAFLYPLKTFKNGKSS